MTNNQKRKVNGEVFTPIALANFLAQRIISYMDVSKCHSINDPACGDGALLYALSYEIFRQSSDLDFEISGFDKDSTFLTSAKQTLAGVFPNAKIELQEKDYVAERYNSLFLTKKYSAIIANPPYVRTQILGEEITKSIAKQYDLKGRIDLYFPFLINMTDSLEEGGILGVITSNRYLSTKSGEVIRKFLLDHYDILEIIDLGDTKLFDAAVLPAIFLGRKNSNRKKNDIGKFLKIYETSVENATIVHESIYSILNTETTGVYNNGQQSYYLTAGKFVRPNDKSAIWQMTTDSEQLWVNNVHKNTFFKIGDKFKVRVGVKSCADDVFLTTNTFTEKDKPEAPFWARMISQENISAWKIDNNLPEVIYPHFDNNGRKGVLDIEQFPKAKCFFSKHEERLKKRTYLTKTRRKWYEYWVPQNPCLWKRVKLVFPDISVEPRFAVDYSGAIVNGNCYWMVADNDQELNLLLLIEGVANSSLMIKYHDLCFNNKLYNGRRRYLTQYVEQYPLPDPACNPSKRIIELVKEIHMTSDYAQRKWIAAQIDQEVNNAFSITD